MIRPGLDAIDMVLQKRLATGLEGKNVDYTPPTESKFVAAVAKDMAGELFSPSRLAWIVIAIFVIIAILAVIWIRTGIGI